MTSGLQPHMSRRAFVVGATSFAAGAAVANMHGRDTEILNHTAGTTRAAMRTMSAALDDFGYSIEAFRASGNDDTTTWTKARDSGEKRLFIPPKAYALDEAIAWSNHAVRIQGAGQRNAILKWTSEATTIGLSFTQNDDDYFTDIRDITFLTEKQALGTALTVDMSGQAVAGLVSDRLHPRLLIADVDIRGVTGGNPNNTDGWEWGIELIDVMHGSIVRPSITGMYDTNGYNTQAAGGVHISGSSQPATVLVLGAQIYFVDDAVLSESTEGVSVLHSHLVAVRRGVRFNNAGSEPLAFVAHNHINAYEKAISTTLQTHCHIHDNDIYSRPDINASTDFVAIEIGSSANKVHDNTIKKYGSPNTFTGIDVTAGADTDLDGNTIDTADTAYRIGPSASNTKIRNPTFRGTIGARYDDSGTETIILARKLSDSNSSAVTVSSGTFVVGISLGGVKVGQKFQFHANVGSAKGATGGLTTYWVDANAAGTATVTFNHNHSRVPVRKNSAASDVEYYAWSGYIEITGDGTCTIQILGTSIGSDSTVAIDDGQLVLIEL